MKIKSVVCKVTCYIKFHIVHLNKNKRNVYYDL